MYWKVYSLLLLFLFMGTMNLLSIKHHEPTIPIYVEVPPLAVCFLHYSLQNGIEASHVN